MLESLSADRYRLCGDISMQSSASLLVELLALPQNTTGPCLHLDLAAVQSADSALLAVLLGLARALGGRDRQLRISGLAPGLHGLATTYGIDTLLDGVMEEQA